MSCGFSVTFHAVSCYSKYEASLECLIPESLRQLYLVVYLSVHLRDLFKSALQAQLLSRLLSTAAAQIFP